MCTVKQMCKGCAAGSSHEYQPPSLLSPMLPTRALMLAMTAGQSLQQTGDQKVAHRRSRCCRAPRGLQVDVHALVLRGLYAHA